MQTRWLLLACLAPALYADNWPQWRGAELRGVSRETGLPLTWIETENITWKLPLPTWSGATPVACGERLFLNAAEDANSLSFWCADRQGKVHWKRSISTGNRKARKQEHVLPVPGH